MSYYKCVTCKTILANKELLYDKMLEDLCNREKSDNNETIQKEKQAILDKLELHRPCCRMRMLGKINLVDIIK